MKIVRSITQASSSQEPAVIVLGNFDGFHKGHQVVVGEAGRIAREQGLPLAVFTTEPHPRSFFADQLGKEQESFRLTAFQARSNLLEVFGVDILYVLDFDKDMAATSADDFVQSILLERLRAKHIVVGYDYQFGKGRVGDVTLLQNLSKKLGFDLTIINPVTLDNKVDGGEIYSSSLVREALKNGEVRQAANILGHWWSIIGTVIDGDKRGRELGFPTINVDFGDSIIPRHGVYAVRLTIEGKDKQFEGAANIGRRPTFGQGSELLEVYIFDFDEEIYGLEVAVEIVAFIRDEARFESVEELIKYIDDDCIVAKHILSDPANDPNLLEAPSLENYLQKYPKPHG